MATPPLHDIANQPESGAVRDVSKFIVEHPIALYDPLWLKRLHHRCLWDGGTPKPRSSFCSTRCEERYAEWEHLTTHVVAGREPLQTFFEQGRVI